MIALYSPDLNTAVCQGVRYCMPVGRRTSATKSVYACTCVGRAHPGSQASGSVTDSSQNPPNDAGSPRGSGALDWSGCQYQIAG